MNARQRWCWLALAARGVCWFIGMIPWYEQNHWINYYIILWYHTEPIIHDGTTARFILCLALSRQTNSPVVIYNLDYPTFIVPVMDASNIVPVFICCARTFCLLFYAKTYSMLGYLCIDNNSPPASFMSAHMITTLWISVVPRRPVIIIVFYYIIILFIPHRA